VTISHPVSRSRLTWLAGGAGVGLLVATLATPLGSLAQSPSPTPNGTGDSDFRPSISVTGTGRVKAEPDVADINLGVTKQADDAQTAADDAATTMAAVIAALQAAGVADADIQTTTISLTPVYDYDDNPPQIEGWEASNLVNITVRDIDSVGAVVDAATGAGATNINGITFRVDDATAAEAEARAAAVADARAKADQLAEAAGVTIIGVLSMSESGAQPPMPIFMERAAFDMAAGEAATPVMPGQVELSINVFVQFEISG
jgi:uncharacterized protein YggE